jgi:prophage regulatory protein
MAIGMQCTQKIQIMKARDLTYSEMKAPGKTLINRKQLLKIVPLSERTILDMEKRGEFPRRFAITSRLVAWDLSEVEQWIAGRKAAAMQPSAPGI